MLQDAALEKIMRIKVTSVTKAEKGMAQVTILVDQRYADQWMVNFPGWLEASVKSIPEIEKISLGDPPKPPEDEGCMTCQKCFKCNCGRPECSMVRRRGACACEETLRADKSKPPPPNEDMQLLKRGIHHLGQGGLGLHLDLGEDYEATFALWRTMDAIPDGKRAKLRELVKVYDKLEQDARAADAKVK